MRTLLLILLTASHVVAAPPHLDKAALLQREAWWDNRDWSWYEANIPFFDCPDKDIVTTYYYRWELVTKHLVEGDAEHGYAFTEFMDRPGWSGTYGAISCPAGHQLYEVRWLRDQKYAQDYARYWHTVPGAQPRNYSTWLADATWAVHAVQEAPQMLTELYEPLKTNYAGWEKRHLVKEKGLFWQHGHDDGMEFNINSRQTKDILRGGDAFRPTLNAYLWADAMAISRTAELLGKPAEAETWAAKARGIKETMQKELWDTRRHFFFPRSLREETSKEGGHVVKADTLTYESGQYAGNMEGRELIGYVPWQFSMPDAGKGYEAAWSALMDPHYFASAYGPTTVGQRDPMFLLMKGCCWWSGRSWPYATAQTLKALANVLQEYEQNAVTAADYIELLRIYAQTHRKNGKPYLAEAADPFTGSWEGHDAYNHSEHYFHSSYCDLILTGLMGLDVKTQGKLGLHPLFPESWDYAAVDNLSIRGREVSVFWDKTGEKYGRGKGLHVWVDGREVVSQATAKPIIIDLAPRPAPPTQGVPLINLAVNNLGGNYPAASASSEGPKSSASMVLDGQYWYTIHPPNRWTSQGQEGQEAWLELDFGTSREFTQVELALIDDAADSTVAAPQSVYFQERSGDTWRPIAIEGTGHLKPDAMNRIQLHPTQSRYLRAMFKPADGKSVGVSEFRVLGPASVENKSAVVPDTSGNLASKAKLSASHTSNYDFLKEACDGIIQYNVTPRNRWTCYDSKQPVDWLAFHWDQPQAITHVELAIFDDRGGVQAPESFVLEYLEKDAWKPIPAAQHLPAVATGRRINTVSFPTIQAADLRIRFKHRKGSYSGVTEVHIR